MIGITAHIKVYVRRYTYIYVDMVWVLNNLARFLYIYIYTYMYVYRNLDYGVPTPYLHRPATNVACI